MSIAITVCWKSRPRGVRPAANMKLLIYFIALVASTMSQSNVELLSAGNDQFTAKMFQEVVKANPGENIVLSAFSVLSPLAQLAVASVGESHDEILKAIGLPNDNVVKESFTNLNKQLQSENDVELNLANRVYVRKGEVLNEQYAVVSRDVFNSDVKNVDFSQKREAANEINTWQTPYWSYNKQNSGLPATSGLVSWENGNLSPSNIIPTSSPVEDNTKHRIKDLVSPRSLSADTAAVLVNAIYFKGMWATPFGWTGLDKFYVSKDKIIDIPVMKKRGYYNYGESKELDAKLLELPYEGNRWSLLAILPNQIDGICSLIEKLSDPSVVSNAVQNMQSNEVSVTMAKFKIETSTDLKAVLEKMNVVKLFRPNEARLDKMIKGQSNLFISKAVQKVFIDVNEFGTEAAASNAFSMYAGFSPVVHEVKHFHVDRPFYFALLMNNVITFNGIFAK